MRLHMIFEKNEEHERNEHENTPANKGGNLADYIGYHSADI